MRKLPEPPYNFNDVLKKCSDGMEQVNVKANFLASKQYLIPFENQYRALGGAGHLCRFPKITGINRNSVVVPGLTKSKLESLYTSNLRNLKKPARLIYDELLASAKGRCPFCGEIGVPKNIDHFLPIAHFPQLSVLPLNLVPSCRDCNMGEKGDDYATAPRDQILHPYLDDDIFYTQQWVFASYISNDINDPVNPGVVIYTAAPPDTWSLVDAQRAIKHFTDFDLASRYSARAGDHLTDIVSQRNSFYEKNRESMSEDELKLEFIDTILEPVITGHLFENHWRKIMYKCLSQSRDFLQSETVDVFNTSKNL
ncbi:HNH endonuclease [Aeromonas sp. sif2416]|uniref:HNH endonuclease n=1 Tax=Aeromonas sp. sif2416 TaxID=2854793 RepID=UPI001C454E8B|nr:HNH endonuclease signature motif containing protein [Aeromonas sp. sif2416]MBV7437601.1 HNH endonuclease [Aeromonas sp. sif2416]